MTAITTTPVDVNIGRLAAFRECDQAVDQFIRSWRDAAEAMLRIEREELWRAGGYNSHRDYWIHKGEDARENGLEAVTYQRVMQLIDAARTTDALTKAGIATEAFESEKSLRPLGPLPQEVKIDTAAAVVEEHQATGRPVTEKLTKAVAEEITAGLSFEEVQGMFSRVGRFNHFTPNSRKNSRSRFSFEGLGTTALFENLKDAVSWLRGKACLDAMNCVIKVGDRVRQYDGFSVGMDATVAKVDPAGGLIHLELLDGKEVTRSIARSNDWVVIDVEPVEPVVRPVSTVVDSSETAAAPTVYPPDSIDTQTQTPQKRIHQAMVTGSKRNRDAGSPHDENNTPERLWKPALEAWGIAEFTLDPATNERSSVPARHKLTKKDDALNCHWGVEKYVLAWCNWAWSLNEEFSLKFIEELEVGNVNEALVLDKADSRTAWGQRLMSNASAILRVYGYVAFENEHRDQGSATFPVDLYYYGYNIDKFTRAYQHLGLITVPVVPELIAE